MDRVYRVKPLAQALEMTHAPINSSAISGQWPCKNIRIDSNRIVKRWDHETFRTMASGDVIQAVPVYSQYDGSQIVFALTETDLCRVRTGTSETYSYATDTYTTGTIVSISGTTVTGDSTAWNSSGLAAGDKFVTDGDHTANGEPDTSWATISSITDDTHLELSASYGGATTSGTYKARKVYSVPSGERWSWAVVNGKFCFTNGNVYGQYWSPAATYATNLGTSYVYQARYCLGYANRLWLADLYDEDTAARNPWKLRGSKFKDPTNYTDSTAVDYYFYDASEPITGLGIVDGKMVVYRKTMYHIGDETGTSTDPLQFSSVYQGHGLYAPYSLVQFSSTNAWLGVDDFYVMNGNIATSIGGPIRKKFFEIVDDDDLEKVVGVNNYRFNEILWMANTTEGQKVFSWNYKENNGAGSWSVYDFDTTLTGFGGFGI